jgi:hypothetical protein
MNFLLRNYIQVIYLGDSNMFNRMLLEFVVDANKIRKEQQRIETELLNFEQDLWEY